MAIQVHDEAGLLGPGDLSSLQAATGRWPFEVHVITSTSAPSKAAFEAQVSKAVDGPNVVAIGVDPTHHLTIVHFGKETGVPASQWSSIYSAGNNDFKSSHWASGLIKIADRATNAKRQAETVTIQPDRPGASTDHTGLWIFGGIVAVACIIGLYYWWKAKKQAEERQRLLDLEMEEAAERNARNREEREWHDKYKNREAAKESSPPPAPRPTPRPTYSRPASSYMPAPAPAPSTVVVNQSGGSGDLMTGYMLGRMDSPRVVEREVIVEEVVERPRHRHYVEPTPSYSNSDDSGGGSSSWGSSGSSNDSGGGSSSSWSSDSGGGSSSWDSGSSFDSGGGGFDSGGGGSDW